MPSTDDTAAQLLRLTGFDHEADTKEADDEGDYVCGRCGEATHFHGSSPEWMHNADTRNGGPDTTDDDEDDEDDEDATEYPADLDLTAESTYDDAVNVVAVADGDGEMRYGSGEDIEHDNNRRAGFVLDALLTYWQRTSEGSEDLGTTVNDFLNDFRHLADAMGEDFDDLTSRDYHYRAELTGDL